MEGGDETLYTPNPQQRSPPFPRAPKYHRGGGVGKLRGEKGHIKKAKGRQGRTEDPPEPGQSQPFSFLTRFPCSPAQPSLAILARRRVPFSSRCSSFLAPVQLFVSPPPPPGAQRREAERKERNKALMLLCRGCRALRSTRSPARGTPRLPSAQISFHLPPRQPPAPFSSLSLLYASKFSSLPPALLPHPRSLPAPSLARAGGMDHRATLADALASPWSGDSTRGAPAPARSAHTHRCGRAGDALHPSQHKPELGRESLLLLVGLGGKQRQDLKGDTLNFFMQPKHGTECFHQQPLSLMCWHSAAGSSLAPALICFSLLLNALLPNIYSFFFFFFPLLSFFPPLFPS